MLRVVRLTVLHPKHIPINQLLSFKNDRFSMLDTKVEKVVLVNC